VSSVHLAASPASFGLGIPSDGSIDPLSPTALLEAITVAGYGGTELPPPGTFGTPNELAEALADARLEAVGAYVPLALLGDDYAFQASLHRLRETLRELSAAGPSSRAVLADAGGAALQQRLATGADEPRLEAGGWSRLIERVHQAVRITLEAGVAASFHHHLATNVETVDEIDRLLDGVPELGLTLDTAHLALAGADVPAAIRRYGHRINHAHLKDADPAQLARVQSDRRSDFLTWWPTLYTPLGQGALDLEAALAALIDVGYRGWLVVEQDRMPFAKSELSRVIAEEAASRRWLQDVISAAEPLPQIRSIE
jgi:inosose dehydratase